MRPLAVLPIVMLLLTISASPVGAQDAKLKINVVGPDGKPVDGALVTFSVFGENKEIKVPPAGEIVVVRAMDSQLRIGKALILIPKKGSAAVVVKTGVAVPYYMLHANKARAASEAGDLDTYNAEALQAKETIDEERADLAEKRRLLEQWKEQNYLPDMTAKEAQAAIERGRAQGIKDTSPASRILMRYKTYLAEIEGTEANIKRHEEDFGTLKPPAKKTTMGPAACPNGEGGLLAGWINSVTGSDLAAACDIDAAREKKDRPRAGSRRDEDRHARD